MNVLKESLVRKKEKELLRTFFFKVRKDCHRKVLSNLSLFKNREERIRGFIQSVFPKDAKTCVSYVSHEDEIDANFIVDHFSSCQWAFPRVVGSRLEFLIPVSKEAFIKNSWGVIEPDPDRSTLVSLSECQMVIVPALAFDRKGYRLGRGRGYYDRALKFFKGLKVGLSYSSQIYNEDLPKEKKGVFLDIPMDIVITERFFFKPCF